MAGLTQSCATVNDYEIGIFGHNERKTKLNPEAYPPWKQLNDSLENEKNNRTSKLAGRHILQKAEHLKESSLLEKAQGVNDIVNAVRYRPDIATWGKDDHWATPFEFMMKKKSGDCEDYAIAKYLMLKELGVEEDNLRIVVAELPDLSTHAVLVIYTDDGALLLDNLNKNVTYTDDNLKYKPLISINAYSIWTHSEEPHEVVTNITSDFSY